MRADDSRQAPLTRESVSKRLSALTADDVALLEERIDEDDWAYIEAAAPLSTFDPDTLKPLRDIGSRSIAQLLASSIIVETSTGARRWRLRETPRRDALARLGSREAILEAYELNRRQADDDLQRAFLAQLRRESKPLELQDRAELAATLRAAQWLHGIVDDVPDPATVGRMLDRALLFEPFHFLVGGHFRGRTEELRRLSDYVGVRPTTSRSEAARRGVRAIFRLRERPPLLVWGAPGAGKSTLIAKFILDHAEYVGTASMAFVYFDFDRATIAAEDPSSLLIEAAQQLACQTETRAEHWTDLRERWVSQVSGDALRTRRRPPKAGPPQSAPAMIDEFAKAYAASFQDAPLLLVLDTFEEVQYRGRDFVDSLWQFLEGLQERIPTLRTVVAGRAQVGSFVTDDLELRHLDEEAAAGVLRARGVEDDELARLIASRVGGHPLTLWLAAARVQQALADRPSLKAASARDVLGLLEIERGATEETFYTRILAHIHDPDVRKLAHPGLVLRRVTRELIRDVLAEPCEVDVPTDEAADRLFELLARETLVSRAPDGSLEHRRDIRRMMLPALTSSRPETVAEIHGRAVDYYAGSDDPVSRAEEIYHRLARGDDPDEVERECWMDGVQQYLRDAIPELPETARVRLAALLKIELDEPVSVEVSQVDRERQTEARVENLMQLGRLEEARDVLAAESDRLPGSRLDLLEAMVLSQLGMVDEPLRTIDAALEAMRPLDATPVTLELLSLAAELETRRGDDPAAAGRLAAGHAVARTLGDHEAILALGLRKLQATRRAQADDGLAEAIEVELGNDVMEMPDDVLRANPDLARELASELGRAFPGVLARVTTALGLDSSFEVGIRELRLAIVCSGGLSLAVYTHGMTREIVQLVLGSALHEVGISSSPSALSAQVYNDLLYALEQTGGVRTRVVVDLVHGTSASGVNGLVLAKALAHNLCQDGMRDFWLERSELLRAKQGLGAWLALVGGLWSESLESLRRRVGWFARETPRLEPRAKPLARMLFDALQDMNARGSTAPSLESLMPEGHRLEASIPVTDVGGHERVFQTDSPRTFFARGHSQAFTFRYGWSGADNFGASGNGALAFAALTMLTSSGDPPVGFDAFEASVPDADLGPLRAQVARTYAHDMDRAADAGFVDGGLLEMKPFAWVAEALERRRPAVEADRRVLYVASADAHVSSGAALSTLAREESLANELSAIRARNERVSRIRDAVEASFATVAELIESIVGADPHALQLEPVDRAIEKRAMAETGPAYATYVRSRIVGAVDGYARMFCDVCDFPVESSHADFVRSVIRAWAEERGLFAQSVAPSESQRAFLDELDLGYRVRRLRFVETGLRWWYRDLRNGVPGVPPRADLDRARTLLYDAREQVRVTMSGDAFDEDLRAGVMDCFPAVAVREFWDQYGFDGREYLRRHRSELEAVELEQRAFVGARLDGFDERLYRGLVELTNNWHPDRRRSVFVRYLGFPLWDVLLYPIQAFDHVGEADAVSMQTLSPYGAVVLSTHPREKLKGRAPDVLSDRAGRESEYLWGRLDAAAHLIGIVLGKDHPDYRAWCLRAFAAILDEETAFLPHIPDTVAALRTELRAM